MSNQVLHSVIWHPAWLVGVSFYLPCNFRLPPVSKQVGERRNNFSRRIKPTTCYKGESVIQPESSSFNCFTCQLYQLVHQLDSACHRWLWSPLRCKGLVGLSLNLTPRWVLVGGHWHVNKRRQVKHRTPNLKLWLFWSKAHPHIARLQSCEQP